MMNKNELKEKVIEYVDRVFFFCIKRVKNRMDAEDLAQTIILEVLKSIEKGLVPADFDFYIWGVCRNQYNMYLRIVIKDRENLEYFEEITTKDDGKSVLDELIEDEKLRSINTAIKLLSKDYAEILYAYYVEDRTLKFISQELNIPLGTVTWKLSKIREKLKEYLKMEQLNGKKAYIPTNFSTIAGYDKKLPFDLHETVMHLYVKNLLWHTYDNPCTIEDLSIEMGMARPYVEDIVNTLTVRGFLLEEDNKYKSNVVFVTKDIVEKVRNCLQNFEGTFIDKAISFASENLEYYKSIVENKDIPDNLLMWSLLMNILSYTNTPKDIHTKKFGDCNWSFCLLEMDDDYDHNDFYISWNGFGDKEKYNFWGNSYPAAPNSNRYLHDVHKSISYNKATNGSNLDATVVSKILFDNLEYDNLTSVWKEEIDKGIELNICRIEDGIVKIVIPVIKSKDFAELKKMCLNNEELKNSYFELFNKVLKVVENNIPQYLKADAGFVVNSLINPLRSHLLKEAYERNLLGLDEEHDFFVYNTVIVKC